jgi:hypothetical protein
MSETKDENMRLSPTEFEHGLADAKAKREEAASTYADMPPEGKRRCMQGLVDTIASLQKMQKDLLRADHRGRVKDESNVLQVVLRGAQEKIVFTQKLFTDAFVHRLLQNPDALPGPVPCIVDVSIESNFEIDSNQYLQPKRMHYVEFSSKDETQMMLGLKALALGPDFSPKGPVVEFVRPVMPAGKRTLLRHIGARLARLASIDTELKGLGAVREYGTVPSLGPCHVPLSEYRQSLESCKRLRASGLSLGHHEAASLFRGAPVDADAIRARIKALWDEECDIVIELREYQLDGVGFKFQPRA